MSLFATTVTKSASWPIALGAEGIAAAQFARCGFDVQMQRGHDKPWYDLVVTKSGNLLKVPVKATENGRWSLAQSYARRLPNIGGLLSDAQRAIDLWLDIHGSRTVYCLVQFEGVALSELPRIYLASPMEIASRMRASMERIGDSTLFEQYEWNCADTGLVQTESLPSGWLFSRERIEEMLHAEVEVVGTPKTAQAHHGRAVWPAASGLQKVALSA